MSVSNAKKQSNSIYYNIDIYNDNSTNGDISSKYSTAFNSPLLMDTSNYEVACVRARIPLDSVSISRKNIPFQQWSVELGIPVLGQPAHTYTYYSEYVPQFNALPLNENRFTLGINTNNLYTTSLPENEPTTNPTLTLALKSPVLPVPVAFQLGGIVGVSNTVCGLSYTAVCIDDYNISRYVTATGAFVDTQNMRVFFELPLANVLGICMAPNSNRVYAIIYDGTNNHYLCDVFNNVVVIEHIDETGLQLGLLSISCSTNYLSFGYLNTNNNNNLVQIWSLNQVNNPVNITTQSKPGPIATYLDSGSAFFIGLIDTGTFYRRNPVTDELIQTYTLPETLNLDRFLGTDAYGNLLVGIQQVASGNYSILAYGKQSALLKYSIAMGGNQTLVTSNMILVATGAFVNNPAPYAVQTINEYINQINLAFVAIMAKIPAPLPSSPQITPYLEFDSATRLVSIICDSGCWSGTNPAGINPPCVINFNQLLWSFFKFNSIAALYTALPSIGGQVRTLQINKAIPPSALSISMQPSSTIYRFADITRIIIGTSKMSVYGDNQNNDKLLVNLSDFTIDTENGIPSLIIFNPVILRFYKLYQQTPLQQLDVFVSYADRAGDVFPIMITPYNSIGLKLEFHRIPLVETI